MVNRSLISLFDKPDPGVGFRQGTVLTWDADTGENTISVAGGTLTNVSILNTGEAIALKAGHTVGLLTFMGSWFILGRITMPLDADFASASLAFGSATDFATNFAVNAPPGNVRTSDTIAVPPWADEAAVTCIVNASIFSAAANAVTAYAQIDGVNGVGQRTSIPAGAVGAVSASAQRVLTSLGSTILVEGRIETTSGIIAASATSAIGVTAIAVFRSTV